MLGELGDWSLGGLLILLHTVNIPCSRLTTATVQGLVEGSLERSTTVDAKLQTFWKSYFQLQSRQHRSLEVAVLALAKSGALGLLFICAPTRAGRLPLRAQ